MFSRAKDMAVANFLWTGYPMAKNLRARIPEGDSLTVFDVNRSSADKLKSDAPSAYTVHVAESPREVAEKSVRIPLWRMKDIVMSLIVLSMI